MCIIRSSQSVIKLSWHVLASSARSIVVNYMEEEIAATTTHYNTVKSGVGGGGRQREGSGEGLKGGDPAVNQDNHSLAHSLRSVSRLLCT